MARTRANWVEIERRNSSDAPQVITVEVMEDGAQLPKGTRVRIDRPRYGEVCTFTDIDGKTFCLELDQIEEVKQVVQYVRHDHPLTQALFVVDAAQKRCTDAPGLDLLERVRARLWRQHITCEEAWWTVTRETC